MLSSLTSWLPFSSPRAEAQTPADAAAGRAIPAASSTFSAAATSLEAASATDGPGIVMQPLFSKRDQLIAELQSKKLMANGDTPQSEGGNTFIDDFIETVIPSERRLAEIQQDLDPGDREAYIELTNTILQNLLDLHNYGEGLEEKIKKNQTLRIEQARLAEEAAAVKAQIQFLVTTRDALLTELRGQVNYCDAFEHSITSMTLLSNESLNPTHIIMYTERVNTVLRALLAYPTFYTYLMEKSQQQREAYNANQDPQFINSQAIKSLLLLEDALSLDPLSLPAEPRYQDLIEQSRKILNWKGLLEFVHEDKTIEALLHDEISEGIRCQLEVSILYKMQDTVSLPFIIQPLDNVVDVPQNILDAAAQAAGKYTADSAMLHYKLYTLPFWQTYAEKGIYTQDPTIQDTALEEACQYAEKAFNTPAAEGAWCQEYAQLTPEDAKKKAIRTVFHEGIKATMETQAP